jgi:phytoene/squalene synthetase
MDFMTPSPLRSLAGVEDYAELTQSSILHLCLQCSGVTDAETRLVASHVGKAIGISLLLRSIPFMAAKGQIVIPLELFGKHKIGRQSYLAGQTNAGTTDATFELACIGKNHMDQARSLSNTIDKQHAVHFLPLVCQLIVRKHVEVSMSHSCFVVQLSAADYYAALEAAQFDPFAPSLTKPINSLALQLKMLKHRVMNTY